MITPFILPFDKNGKEMKVNGIDFLNVSTCNATEAEFIAIGKSGVAAEIFRFLCGFLSFPKKKTPVQLSLFLHNIEENIENLGVLYLEDGTILPIRFSESTGFVAFCKILLQNGETSYYYIINPSTCKGHSCSKYITSHNPFQELGSWITKIAPKGFARINDNFLKENYLSQFLELDVPKAAVNKELLGTQWKELLEQEHLQGNEALIECSIFETFKTETGFDFPEELKTIYLLNNGVNKFIGHTQFLSACGVLSEWNNWNAIYKSTAFSDLVNNYQDKNINEKMVPLCINPYRIPFMHDGGGNFIAIDMLPNKSGNKGQIVAFGVDEVAIRYVAENMSDFLSHFFDHKYPMNTNGLNAGTLMGF